MSSIHITAQSFKYSVGLAKVAEEGFYKVVLPPQVIARANDDLSDLRLYDEDHKEEVPYLLKKESVGVSVNDFKEYPIVKKSHVAQKYTEVIVENVGKSPIDNLCIRVQNNDVYKTASLSGSNDQKIWYAVKDAYQLENMYSTQTTFADLALHFPINNYLYFKISIQDSLTEPLMIQKVGYFENSVSGAAEFQMIPQPKVFQSDSHKLKSSFYKVVFEDTFLIDRLRLNFSGAKFFNRKATLLKVSNSKTGNIATESVREFRVMSNADNLIELGGIKSKEYLIVVENEDNQPLALQHVEAKMLQHFLLVHLQQDINYQLKLGDRKLQAPSYDLAYFEDSIPHQLHIVALGTLTHLVKHQGDYQMMSKPWFKNKLWVWISIALVSMLLVYIVFKMLREIGAKP